MQTTYWDDIRQSIFNLLDHRLMENGAYVNIVTGQKDARGQDISLFYSVSDSELGIPDGCIWQSAFHNFAYESGVINVPPPTLISGIYINGAFTPKSNSMHIDYANGRVILDTPISTSSVVKSNFSYKEYTFVSPSNTVFFKNQTKYINNHKTYTNPFPASPYLIYLPAIFIELDTSREVGFEFGGTTETFPTFRLTLVSDVQSQIEGMASIFSQQATKSFPVVSANNGPKFDNYGDLMENYSFYTWFNTNKNFALLKSVNYNRFYDSKDKVEVPSLYGGVIDIEISAIR